MRNETMTIESPADPTRQLHREQEIVEALRHLGRLATPDPAAKARARARLLATARIAS